MSKIRILLIEDDEDDFIIIRNLLEDVRDFDFVLEWEPDPDKALLKIEMEVHDIYLLDYRLGPRTGLDLLAEGVVA